MVFKKRPFFAASSAAIGAILAIFFILRRQNEPLEERLVHKDLKIREAAASEIKYLSDSSKGELVPLLISVLRQGGRSAAYAAEALGRLGEEAKDAIPDLLMAFKSPDHALSSNSIWALGEIGAEAAPSIATLLEDEDSEVRVIAVLALEKVEIGAVPYLIRALKDEDSYVRLYAIGAIEEIGEDALEALPYLDTLSRKDPDSGVRERAGEVRQSLRSLQRR